MAPKSRSRQLNNGQPRRVDNSHLAELVGSDHDQPSPDSTQELDDALGESTVQQPSKPAVNIDLDDVLGDEQALKHGLLVDEPPPIEVRVPRKREFLMVHPTYCRVAQIVEYTAPDGMGRTYYLATGNMRRKLEEEDVKTVLLVPCMSLADQSVFLWPINVDEDGNENVWNESSRRFAERAKAYWARRVSYRKSGGQGYGVKFAPGGKELAKWPEKSMAELITEAFRDRIIDSVDHPVYQALEGRI
jgi:hypothetical protein